MINNATCRVFWFVVSYFLKFRKCIVIPSLVLFCIILLGSNQVECKLSTRNQGCQEPNPLDDSSLFVTCSGNIQLDIGIPLLVEHTASAIGQPRNSTSQGMLQSSQQGDRSEMGQVLKIVLVSPLDSIEFIGMLVNTRL